MNEATPTGKQHVLSDLLALKLGIGDVVQLQDMSATKQRHFVKLIGYLNKKSFLVSHPLNNEQLLFVKKGDFFLVRGFSSTKTYEFNSEVLNVCLAPYPYLHLSFPSQISTVSMRSAMRIKIKLVCSIKLKGGASTIAATIGDMSVGGARIQAKVEFGQVGDAIDVSFRLPVDGVDQLLAVPAIIRNIGNEAESADGEHTVLYGVEFQLPEGNERNILQYFIYKNMVEG